MEINLDNKKPDIRYLNDMRGILYDKDWAKTAPNLELYYMYRGIEEKDGLRYDITVIPAAMLGKEFNKTKGHEHSNKKGEVYIVLEGRTISLMQKNDGEKIKDVIAIEAKKGDVIIIPPGYGHITINPAKEELKMANWISDGCKNDFALFEKMGGACYYYTKAGWVKNENYKNVPNLRFEKPQKKLPKDLSFLKG
jgi:glucose-6-phosphate isomerase